jgi:hypothetical protein
MEIALRVEGKAGRLGSLRRSRGYALHILRWFSAFGILRFAYCLSSFRIPKTHDHRALRVTFWYCVCGLRGSQNMAQMSQFFRKDTNVSVLRGGESRESRSSYIFHAIARFSYTKEHSISLLSAAHKRFRHLTSLGLENIDLLGVRFIVVCSMHTDESRTCRRSRYLLKCSRVRSGNKKGSRQGDARTAYKHYWRTSLSRGQERRWIFVVSKPHHDVFDSILAAQRVRRLSVTVICRSPLGVLPQVSIPSSFPRASTL